MAGSRASRQPFEIAHRPQHTPQGHPQAALLHQARHHLLTPANGGAIHQGSLQPAAQAAAPHGGEGAVDRPQQRSLQHSIPLGGGELQVAAGLGIEHQGIPPVHDDGHIQRHRGALLQRLGVLQVAQQAPQGPQGEGQFRETEAIEAGQLVVAQQGRFRIGAAEGGAGDGCELQMVGAPGRFPVNGAAEQFGGRQLGQLLMQGIAGLPLHHLHLAGAHIGAGQSPAQGAIPLGGLHHHRRQPVVAARTEQTLLQHGAGGEHPGDVAFEQGPLGRGGLQLIAEGHAEAAADQLTAVALGGVVGNAGHGHAADGLAPLFAGEGELQHPGEGDGIFKEALEEIAEPIEQHPLGMGGFELHVVAQHRGELLRIHLAVVGPGRFIGVAAGVRVRFRIGRAGFGCLALPGARGRIGAQGGVAEVVLSGVHRPGGSGGSGSPNRLP